MNVTEMEETLRTGFVRSVAEELYSPDGFFVGG